MKKIIRNNIRMLGYVWKNEKLVFVIAALFCVCDIISPFQDTYLPKLIIDQLSEGNTEYSVLFGLVVLFLAGSMYKVIIYPLFRNYYSPIAKTRVAKALNAEMIGKIKNLDLKCYEDENFFNQYPRALNELDSRAYGVFESVVSLLRYIIYISVLSSIIIWIDPFLLFIAVFCAIVSVVSNKIIAKKQYTYHNSLTPSQRGCEYCKRVLYVPEYAKETRFFPITRLIKNRYENYVNERIRILKSGGKKLTICSIIPEVITTLLLHGVVVAYLVMRISKGSLTPGDFVALLLATSQFSYQLAGFGNQLNSFYTNSLYIDNINNIFDYQPEVESRIGEIEECGMIEQIKFKNVSFSYDPGAKLVLDKINFTINRGEKIAIVGLNGSGKSTLIKLLLNLYKPTDGIIEQDGIDIMKISTDEYRSKFGVIFQDFHSFSFSVIENILFAPTENIDKEARYEVDNALKKVGMLKKIKNLSNGVDTPISKELSKDGVSFSGGEMQSIMLARLFIGDHSVLILDEPTSSLDPFAEYNLYNEVFEKKDPNQTVIIISHKLITTKNADRIYYMENGMILESGTHSELIEKDGKYAQLYNVQKKYYMSEK